MKDTLVKLITSERGAALLLTMVVLLLGSLIMAPLLGFMSTGILAGKVHEERLYELYSADSGVEDALHQIQTVAAGLPAVGEQWSYTLSEQINAKQVQVVMEHIDPPTYKITSTASKDASSSTSTTIESYASILYFDLIMNNAITSPGDVIVQPGGLVDGDVQYNGALDNKGDITGNIKTDEIKSWEWPTADEMCKFYTEYVKGLDPYADDTIDLKNVTSIPSLYRVGDLNIANTGPAATVPLDGIIYVAGNLTFEQPGGPKAYTIDLAGQTIFAEGDIFFPPQRVSIAGPGAIIAVGDITFQPGIETEDRFVFVMSVNGQVWFSPMDSFYGSVAGNVNINLQPNVSLYETSVPDGLRVPGEDNRANIVSAIHTWVIHY